MAKKDVDGLADVMAGVGDYDLESLMTAMGDVDMDSFVENTWRNLG